MFKLNYFFIFIFFILFNKIISLIINSPIIFLPGYSGSMLYTLINDINNIPYECKDIIPINIKIRILGNITLEKYYPKCVESLMKINYNINTNKFLPLKDINIFTNKGYEGIVPVYWPFKKTLESWGYQTYKNSFGQPYDYRYLSIESFNTIGFNNELKELVEKAYNLNHQQKVILIGHSNGGPTLYYFLSSMSIEWKEKYLAALIGLSGNFLGQLNGIKSFIYSDNQITQNMMNTWEAQYKSFTWGEYIPSQTVVTTYFNTVNEKKYTTSTNDIIELLKNTNNDDWVNRYIGTSKNNNRSIAPSGIDIYCLYGQGINTSSAFIFEENIMMPNSPPIETIYTPGDGNQDNIDNTFCNQWKEDVERDGKHTLESIGFDGVHHMQMYLDENVLNKIHEIIQKYSSELIN